MIHDIACGSSYIMPCHHATRHISFLIGMIYVCAPSLKCSQTTAVKLSVLFSTLWDFDLTINSYKLLTTDNRCIMWT